MGRLTEKRVFEHYNPDKETTVLRMKGVLQIVDSISDGGKIKSRYYLAGKAIDKLAEYEDMEEQEVLYRKVWALVPECHKPRDCEGDCEFCDWNGFKIQEEKVKISEIDADNYFLTKEAAEAALKEMER